MPIVNRDDAVEAENRIGRIFAEALGFDPVPIMWVSTARRRLARRCGLPTATVSYPP